MLSCTKLKSKTETYCLPWEGLLIQDASKDKEIYRWKSYIPEIKQKLLIVLKINKGSIYFP